jgi:hypothetical protein
MTHTETLDKAMVEELVADWKKRLTDLYATIATWLEGTEYTLKPSSKRKFYEGPMYYNDVPPTMVDTATIYKGKEFLIAIRPIGLWVIGSNGMVELSSLNGNSHSLLDTANEFETPQWVLFINRKGEGIKLNKESLVDLIKSNEQ